MQQNAPQPQFIEPQRAKNIIYFLAASLALTMTGFGIVMPVFARRLNELGSGVEALGIMTMAFALSQMLAAPLAGVLADKYGRRPLVLVALAGFVAANMGYLLASTTPMFIGVRFLGGLLTAGLFPAAMGIVADVTREEERGKWIGLVMAGFAAGIVFGPVLGGLLYDGWGFAAPFVASGGLAMLAFIAATILVPETLQKSAATASTPTLKRPNLRAAVQALPRPHWVLAILLFVDFALAFAFAFIEPQMVFYLYNTLGWSTAQFGVVVGAYGLAMLLGQSLLGQLSDRFGRRPMILAGIVLHSVLYPTIAFATYFPLVLFNSALAGLGMALLNPALSAAYLDIAEPQVRSRVVGLKEATLSAGNVAGPLLVAVAAAFLSAQAIFMAAGLLVLLAAVVAVGLPRLLKPGPVPIQAAEVPTSAAAAAVSAPRN